MRTATGPAGPLPTIAELGAELRPYQKSNTRRSILQLVDTLIPYCALWYLMVASLKVSYALTLALAVIAAGFLVRIFIMFHDCGHGSFFASTRTNRRLGFWLGVLVFTPGEHWWHAHAIHHATSGNLDRRGDGDVRTITVGEWRRMSRFGRFAYAFFRNPLVMFVIGPIYTFVLLHRLPIPRYGRKETLSVIWADLAIVAIGTGMSLLIGVREYLLIQLAVLWLAGAAGIWMFYIQHQHPGAYWEHADKWSYVSSALLGASFYKLPRLLMWFTGDIGYHHIHHLSPKIPNYYLQAAHEHSPLVQQWVHPLGFADSLRATRLKVWNEQAHQLQGFPAAG